MLREADRLDPSNHRFLYVLALNLSEEGKVNVDEEVFLTANCDVGQRSD
jgi:hypothetical protein